MTLYSYWLGSAPCSGHGVANSQGLCACDAAWSGGADLFDLRVSDTDGQVLALDCSVPGVGVQVVWTFFLLASVYRAFFALSGLKKHVESLGANADDATFRILAFDVIVCTPLFLVTAALKLTDSLQTPHVIGTDVATTLVFCLATLSTVFMWTAFEILQFNVSLQTRRTNSIRFCA
jgi:hypothetical protein